VLRRHPSRSGGGRPGDLETLAAQQPVRMLSIVATGARPGGCSVYAVCTFERRECEDVVAAFLRRAPALRARGRAGRGGRVPWARLTGRAGAVRTWPHRDGADGFFAVRLAARERVKVAPAAPPSVGCEKREDAPSTER
jgi:16S rRNA (cytosine967-C5)-methyltransferase